MSFANLMNIQRSLAPVAAATSTSSVGDSAYSAAVSRTDAPGYVYFPTLSTRRDLSTAAREEIIRKARWLCYNMGLAGRIRDGIASMVGFLTPSPQTNDQEWNVAAKALFEDIAGSAMIFDRSAQENFYTIQPVLTQLLLQDGDCGLVLTETSTGNPAVKLYQSPQIKSPRVMDYARRKNWRDGVYVSADDVPLSYQLWDGDLSGPQLEVKASEFIHFAKPQTGRTRGLSAFARAADRLLDIRQIDNSEATGIHAANMVGFYLQNEIMSGSSPAMFERIAALTSAGTIGGDGAATKPDKKIQMEEITRSEGAMVELGVGQKLATLHDTRRHPNRQELVEYFIRDCCVGTGFPSEVLWHIGRMTGPGVRFTIRQGERAAQVYRSILRTRFCQRVWTWFVAKMMKQGRLARCRDPRFWNCEWIEPESLTIDLGRDSRAGLDEIQRGGSTFANWYGEVNQDWRQQFSQKAKELAEARRLEQEYNLPPGSLLGTPG